MNTNEIYKNYQNKIPEGNSNLMEDFNTINSNSRCSKSLRFTFDNSQSQRIMKVEDRLQKYKENYERNTLIRKHEEYNKEACLIQNLQINPLSRAIASNMNVILHAKLEECKN